MSAMAVMSEQDYTNTGKPDAIALAGLLGLGFNVTAKSRDEAFEAFKKLNTDEVAKLVTEFEIFKANKEQKEIDLQLAKDKNKADKESDKGDKHNSYFVSVKQPATRRCRAGVCFEGEDNLVESPTKKQLTAWEDDDYLIVKKA